ncbi:MAG: site-specific DNA-methyltransferase [Betaproteobacteria bacterium]
MSELAIVYRRTEELVPYAANARTHSAAQVEQLAASMREFGFTNPILVDGDGGVIAGHGRILAAKRLGLEVVPTIALADLTPAQRRAYVLADNQLAMNAGWDRDLLALELKALSATELDLALIGFAPDELTALLGLGTASGFTDPDAVPPTPEMAVSVPGDVWVLGRHRLLCGDATVGADVGRLLAGVSPHLMVTDPPYGVDYDPAWRRRAGVNRSARMDPVTNDDRADWRPAWTLFPGAVAYVWHGALHSSEVAASLLAAGFDIRAQIIWAKPRLVLGRGHYHWQHEPCWYAVREGGTGHWSGDRSQTTLWSIGHAGQDAETPHSTQKPVECMRRPIENNSSPGQAVYDPFLGSGTTLIAAEQTGRACYGMELEPRYVDVALTRWQAFTGQEARHAETNRTFAELAAERATTTA